MRAPNNYLEAVGAVENNHIVVAGQHRLELDVLSVGQQHLGHIHRHLHFMHRARPLPCTAYFHDAGEGTGPHTMKYDICNRIQAFPPCTFACTGLARDTVQGVDLGGGGVCQGGDEQLGVLALGVAQQHKEVVSPVADVILHVADPRQHHPPVTARRVRRQYPHLRCDCRACSAPHVLHSLVLLSG